MRINRTNGHRLGAASVSSHREVGGILTVYAQGTTAVYSHTTSSSVPDSDYSGMRSGAYVDSLIIVLIAYVDSPTSSCDGYCSITSIYVISIEP